MSARKPIILVVDDEPHLRELIVFDLKTMDIEIKVASNGKEALDLAVNAPQENPIDVILSDINMPKMTGLQMLTELRRLGFETPCLFLTAYGSKDFAVQALKLGALDFIEKPYDYNILMSTVQKAIEHGVEMRTLNQELDELIRKNNIPKEQVEEFRRAQRAILKMKKEFRKKTA